MLTLPSREPETKASVSGFRITKMSFYMHIKSKTMYSPAKTQDSNTSDRPETPTQVYAFGQQTQDSNDSSTWSDTQTLEPVPERKVLVSRPETHPPVDFQTLMEGDFQVPGHVMVILDEMRVKEEQGRLLHAASNLNTLKSSVKPDEEKMSIANRLVMEMLKRDEMKLRAVTTATRNKKRTKATKATDKTKQIHTKKRPSRKAAVTKHKKSSKKKTRSTTSASNPITNYVTCGDTPSVTTPSVTTSIPFATKVPFATPSPSIQTNLSATPDFKCKGCGGTTETCKEIRWKWICLHRVIDYFEKVGCENVEVEGATDAYVTAYHVLGKLELLNKHNLYSTNSHFSIPQCMVHGSYQMAIDMTKSQKLYCVLMQMRVHDVDDHLGYKLSAERFARDHRDGE